jgi:hypothetical protein
MNRESTIVKSETMNSASVRHTASLPILGPRARAFSARNTVLTTPPGFQSHESSTGSAGATTLARRHLRR